jgi:hypothetical protein
MNRYLKQLGFLFFPAIFIFLFSCTTMPVHPPANNLLAYTVKKNETLLNQYVPIFVIENAKEKYNHIGTPSAKVNMKKKENIYVNPEKATIYSEIRKFKTSKNAYTNLIYRIHFEKTPGSYLGKGNNMGLFFIVTLNSQNRPILYTSVHTCGCYIAFVPTSYMPEDGFPDNWKKERQTAHSESLPGILDFKTSSPDQNKIFILVRDGSHRIKDIWLSTTNPSEKYTIMMAETKPLTSLEKLLLKDKTITSFYETSGSRKGYVKGSHKIYERLLMSWWAFDWRIGEDKMLGNDKNSGILFYTSLKPWAREKSDMRDFETFLQYWKWNL